MTKQDQVLDTLYDLMTIMRYYHKGEAPGHLDACKNPDNCGHCLAMRKARTTVLAFRSPTTGA